MLTLAIGSLLFGAALGLHFRVLVLVPAGGVGLIVIAATSIAYGDSLATMALTMLLSASCLQIGYFVGSAVRWRLLELRRNRHQPDRRRLATG